VALIVRRNFYERYRKKIRYIYFNIDGAYYFLSNQGISDHSKRCVLRRFFILLDSYLGMIGYLKNNLFKKGVFDLKIKKSFEDSIKSIKSDWDNKYEIIRNKFSAHHQNIDDLLTLLEWWNEINYSTITYFYDGMNEIREIIAKHAGIITLTPTDFSEIDFSDTDLRENGDSAFYLSYDRLALSKKNTVGMIGENDFEKKCMLILSIVDFIFINCAVTTKVQQYETYYKCIIFDSVWLMICCDTFSLIENMYEDGNYGESLLSLSPSVWAGALTIREGNSHRDKIFEERLKELRNEFAAHIDTKKTFESLSKLFNNFNLKQLHEYCVYHMQIFQSACFSDISTKKFAFRDQKLPDNILSIPYSKHRTTDN